MDVKNRFDTLTQESDDMENLYQQLTQATQDVAISSLPKKKRLKNSVIDSSIMVKDARLEVEKASKRCEAQPTRRALKALTTAQKELDDAYLSAEAAYISGEISHLSSLHHDRRHAASWKVINKLTGRKEIPTSKLRGGSTETRKSLWFRHFSELLGQELSTSSIYLPKMEIAKDLDIKTDPFNLEELQEALKSFSNNKSPGLDYIPTILWKDQIFHDLLLKIYNYAYVSLTPPSAWLKGGIVPVPKKGDLTIPTNYRGITLLPIAAKIYNKLLLNRIVPKIDPLLRKNQNGFRKGRSTLSQILSIRRIIEECRKYNKEITLCFVDFRKAFDSISREKMFEILHLYGIPPKIIEAIKIMYCNTTATVISPDGETKPFEINAGVLQGDTLAPFLFIVVLDYILRISVDQQQEKGMLLMPRRCTRLPAKYLTDLGFADDLALISHTLKDAESLLHSLEEAASIIGLLCNEDKTEYMTTSITQDEFKSTNGAILKKVDDFKYLGSYIADSQKDFGIRKALAWKACNKLEKIWKSKLSSNLKVDIFKSVVEPILLYGSETWTLSIKSEKRLDGTYTNLLRRVKNLSWKSHPTLAEIYGNLDRLSNVLRQRRLEYAGHCQRADKEVISSLLLWKPSGTVNSRKLTYVDTIVRDSGIPLEYLNQAMADRDVWRRIGRNIPTQVAR